MRSVICIGNCINKAHLVKFRILLLIEKSHVHAFQSIGLKINLVLMQKLKTRVIKKNCNPDWNEELTLSVKDIKTPIHLVSTDASYINFFFHILTKKMIVIKA